MGYRGHKEVVVTLLEEGNGFGEPALRPEGVHHDSAEAASTCRVAVVRQGGLGAPRSARSQVRPGTKGCLRAMGAAPRTGDGASGPAGYPASIGDLTVGAGR